MQKTTNVNVWLFVLPACVLVAGSAFLPLMAVVNYAFHDVFFGNNFIWVGPKWFMQVLDSNEFFETLLRTFAFSALILAIEVPLGIFIALCLPRKGPMVPFYILTMALPLMVPWVVVALLWKLMIHPEWGTLGSLLGFFDIRLDTSNAITAWTVLIFVDVWHWTSLVVLLCFSGLLGIRDSHYQAARIDCASRWSIFRYIELPAIKRVLLIAVLIRFIDSFMIYIEPFVITRGGPGQATLFISQSLMQKAVQQFDFGESSAISLIYFTIIILFVWILFRIMLDSSASKRKA